MSKIDLLLLHPPSVYDFRQHAILYGPVSDLIPSSPVFEMYPLGFLTMTSYLEERGLRVRVVNLALRMMNDPRFDVPVFLAGINPAAVGIDLHWLPHAHGSIEVARLVRQAHPSVPIIFGGLSASYFHQELINYPDVDYVLRGNSVERPLYDLLMCLQGRRSPGEVPNLTWKAGGTVRVNPPSHIPADLDYVDLTPARMVKMVMRHRDLRSVLPFNGWWKNPITAVFTAKGCRHECLTCGSSRQSCAEMHICQQPLFRSPKNLVKNMIDIGRISRGPIFLVGDLRQAGDEHAWQVLDLLQAAGIRNEIIFEFFGMPPAEYLEYIDRTISNWSIELSPESHNETLRRHQDQTTSYTNAEMEAVIAKAQALRCNRIDVFFMIGLHQQTYASVMETIEYCQRLFQISDNRLSCFISPMGPFLDPGSRVFEEPERYGYRLFARTLEEHRQLLIQPTWKRILNYETIWMSRDELVAATYDAAERLNALKLKYGRIDQNRGRQVAARIATARELGASMDALALAPPLESGAAEVLRNDVFAFSVSTVCDKRELFWNAHFLNFRPLEIVRIALSSLLDRSRKRPAASRRPMPG